MNIIQIILMIQIILI